jgi:hypothetical protein
MSYVSAFGIRYKSSDALRSEVHRVTEFSEVIKSWETFYVLVGTAAATLIGLLFVAITINIERFRRRLDTDLQLFAVLTFNCFFYVLVLAIVFVIPGQSPFGLGVLLFVLGGAGWLNTARQFVRARKLQRSGMPRGMVWRFVGPLFCLTLLLAISVAIVLGNYQTLYALVAVNVFLLGSAAQNAWVLLMRPGDEGKERQEKPSA